MALLQIIVTVVFVLLRTADAGFESLSKPFTGAQESAWEAMASKLQAGNAARSRAAASASLAHQYSNSTANTTTITGTDSGPSIPTPSSFTYTGTTASKCNASIQNSYQRMVTDIEKYTLTDGSKQTAVLFDQASIKTFTLTGPTTYTTIVTHAFHPGRPWQAYYPDDYQCCMDCYVYFPEVEVYYWPVPVSEEQCANGSHPITEQATLLPDAKTAEARFSTLRSNHSITGPVTVVNSNGFTFTSPSIYVAFGDVSAGDACGAVGQKHTSVTLAFAPGELQTVTSLGKDHYDTTLGTRAFDPKNVLCPPDFTPETLFVEQDSLAGIFTYRPRIQIPPKLQSLDPAWGSCDVSPYEGIDPPRELVPASGFGDDPVVTTTAAPVQQATPAMAGPTLPKNTGSSSNDNPVSGPAPDPTSDPKEENPDRPQDPPKQDPPKQGPPKQDPPKQDPPKDSASANDPPADPVDQPADPATTPDLTSSNNSPVPQGESPPNSQPKPQPGGGQSSGNSDNGGDDHAIPGQPYDGSSENQDPQQIQPNNPSGQSGGTKSGQPAVVVEGQTIKQGAAPVTIGGKPVIYSQGSVYVGGSGAPAPSPSALIPQQQEPPPVSLGGFKFAPAPQPNPQKASKPAILVAGQRIQEDAPPVTISGKAVQYTSGSVRVGDSAVPISPPKQGQPASPVAVGGLLVTPAPPPPKSNQGGNVRPVVIAKGQTITENGPPATINGKPVVYSGGLIMAGGTRVAVPTAEQGKPATPINVAGLSFTPQPIHSHEGSDVIPAVVVAGHTITEGAPAVTVNGAKLAYSSGLVYVNGQAAPLPTPAPPKSNQGVNPTIIDGLTVYPALTDDPIATVGGQVVHQDSDGVVAIGGSTLIPGGSPVTISGATFSLGPSALIAGTRIINLPLPASSPILYDNEGQPFTVGPSGIILGPGTTIKMGGSAATISGTAYSLAIIGGSTVLVAGSSTIPLSPLPPLPTLDIFSQHITANTEGNYVIAGQTLTPGGEAITVSGTRISLGPTLSGGKEILVIGSSTSTLIVPQTTETGGLDSQILASGLATTTDGGTGSLGPTGGAGVTPGQASPTAFQGAGGKIAAVEKQTHIFAQEFPKVKVLVPDYANVGAVTSLLKENEIHTVISTLSPPSPEVHAAQDSLIRGAAASGTVKRFIPSEWGIDYEADDDHLPLPFKHRKRSSFALLRSFSPSLEYTRIFPGYFLDYFGQPRFPSHMSPEIPFVSMQRCEAAIPGSLTTPVCWTHSQDIPPFILRLLDLPLGEWEDTSTIVGDRKTFGEILEIAEQIRGKKFETVIDELKGMREGKVTELEGYKEMYGEGAEMNEMVLGIMAGFGTGMATGLFDLGEAGTLNSRFLDVKCLSLEEVMEKGWAGQKNEGG
ncbi:MAG: hypothetical protein Q9190_006321 [Brigantiaea leucoxantha]